MALTFLSILSRGTELQDVKTGSSGIVHIQLATGMTRSLLQGREQVMCTSFTGVEQSCKSKNKFMMWNPPRAPGTFSPLCLSSIFERRGQRMKELLQ